MSNSSEAIYQLKVTLRHSKPAIWRRVLVTASVSLSELHAILQVSMGWKNRHAHLFVVNGGEFGPQGLVGEELPGVRNERDIKLSELLKKPKQKLMYEYDFGDSWEHQILLEKILPRQEGDQIPRCIKAVGHCPPEDVGGVWGFYDFLEAMRDPEHPQHQSHAAWWGAPTFDADAVDLEAINAMLERISTPAEDEFHGLSPERMHQLLYFPFESPDLLQWQPDAPVETAPLMRIFKVLAQILLEKEIKLTGKGYLPLAIVRDMLVPAKQELEVLNPHEFALCRHEYEVRPVNVTRLVAEISGFTKQQKGKLSFKKTTSVSVARGQWGKLYMTMLETIMKSFNWAYMDGLGDYRGVQTTAPFVWWLLHRYGEDWRLESFYTQAIMEAFPALKMIPTGNANPLLEEYIAKAVSYRTFTLFHWLGMIERRKDLTEDGQPRYDAPQSIRKTPLFDALIQFVSPGLADTPRPARCN
jgi:hypothetical protein